MRKISLVLLIETAIFVLGLIILAFAIRRYYVYVNYIYDTQDEYRAIKVFESLNYFELTGIPLFAPPRTNVSYDDYVYARYINRQTVDFYTEKVSYLKRKLKARHVTLNYTVTAKFINMAMVNISAEAGELHVCFTGMGTKLTIHREGELSGFIIINKSGVIENIENTTIIALRNTYAIYGILSYEEIYGPLAGYGFTIKQLVILDKDFSLIFVACQPTGYVI